MRLDAGWEWLLILTWMLAAGCGDDGGQGTNQNNNENQRIPVCGDGVIDPGEICDDGAANSDVDPGACRSNCRPSSCGDGVVDPDEACEGQDMAGGTCEGLGFGAGPLTCRNDCTLDPSGCTGWIAVSSGTRHTCAIRPDGQVRCWGRNDYGQLGNGLAETSADPVTVSGIADAVIIAAGNHHTCAALADGTAWCWGANNVGQLGDGTTTDSLVPVPVSGLTGVVGLSASQQDDVTCAVDDAGRGYCWGANDVGQLGIAAGDDSSVPVQVGISGALRKISVGSSYACALTLDGAVWCWGHNRGHRLGRGLDENSYYTPGLVEDVDSAGAFVDVAAMVLHTCAVDEHGHVWCWGKNSAMGFDSLLGRGTFVATSEPGQVSNLDDAVAVAGGLTNACALRTSGEVSCWGGTRLGNGTDVQSVVPVPAIGVEDATAISGGLRHYCALRADRSLACWGFSTDGELGPSVPRDRSVPVPVVGLAGIQGISGSVFHTCAVAGELAGVYCWGGNHAGQLGNGTINPSASPMGVLGLTHVASIAAGNEHTCAARDEQRGRTVWCWGDGQFGATGTGSPDAFLAPVQVPGLSGVTQVSCGYAYCCARLDSGEARCWGLDANGRLGNASWDDQYSPVPVQGLTNVVAVSAGGHHACAFQNDGTAWCWGRGEWGALGNGSQDDSNQPVQVAGVTDATAISAGEGASSCAVRSTGEVLCWGANWLGQLGDGTYDSHDTPVTVANLTGAVSVSAGSHHACALLDDGSVWCWGRGDSGQLGDGTSSDTPLPVRFESPVPAVAVEAAENDTCIVGQSGMAYCSGDNSDGELGDGTISGSFVPVPGPPL